MSTTVDERVVSMRFDNKDFESNVHTSLSTLDKLKKGLNLSDSAKGLTSIGDAAKRVSFTGLAEGVEQVRVKFSALEVAALSVLANITNSVINTGTNIIKSFTVDPLLSGLEEYETKLTAITTILTNTKSKGTTLDEVNSALDELNTYADKTIYNFGEMTRNVGTFTAAGVDLETSVGAIKGIANLAAGSGSSSLQASTAMYQLSQALAEGRMSLQSWNSVVNAGMGGELFQNALVDEAVAMGTLSKESAKAIKNGIMPFREAIKATATSAPLLNITKDMMVNVFNDFANDESLTQAATQVKTFTQLMSTLKESAQSGWAQSWEIIIGTRDEAAKMWTDANKILGGMVGASAEARNQVLGDWKELGGRDLAIKSISNVFNGLLSVINPIKEAFRDIFPAMTGKRLFEITKSIEEFTSHLKLSDEQSKNIKITFKGFFAVLDLVGKAFSSIFKVFAPLLGGIGGLNDGVLGVTASIGKWLIGLNEAAESSNFFGKAVETLSNLVSLVVEKVKIGVTNVKEFASALKEGFILPGLEAAKDSIDSMVTSLGLFGGGAVEAFAQVKTGAKSGIDDASSRLEKFGNFINNIKEGLSNFGKGIKEALGPVAKEIGAAFSDVTMTDAIGTGLIAGIILLIRKLVKNLDKVVANVDDIMNGVVDVLDGARGALEAWQTSLKAETLFKIAAAVALLSVSLIALTFVDPDKLKSGLMGISVLLGEVVATMEILSKFKVTGISTAAASMIIVAVAISILAGAMLKLKDFQTWDQTWPAIVAMAGLMVGMVKSMQILSKSMKGLDGAEFIKTMAGLLIFAFAIKQLANSMASFATLSPAEITKSLITIGILLGEIAAFIKFAEFGTLADGKKTIMEIAVSMLVLYAAVKLFGTLKQDVLIQGLMTITGIMLALTLSMQAMGNVDIKGGAATIMAMAAALILLVIPIKQLGTMDYAQLEQGLIGIGVALGMMVAAMTLSSGTNYAEFGAGLAIMAMGLTLLTIPIKVLGSMPWQALALGLGALAAILVVFGVSCALLAPIGPMLLVVSGALALFGVAILAVGVGLAQLALGFATLAAIGAVGATALIAGLSVIVPGIAALIPQIMQLIVSGIASFAQALATSAPLILASVSLILLALLKMIRDVIPALVETVVILLTKLLETIAKFTPRIVQAAFDILIAILEGIAKNIQKVVQAGADIIIGFLKGIANKLPAVIQAAFEVVISFVNGLADAIRKNTDKVQAAVKNLFTAVIEAAVKIIVGSLTGFVDVGKQVIDSFVKGITNTFEDVKEVGKEVVDGLINGLKEKIDEVVNTAKDIGQNIIDAAKSVLDIHSPSRVFKEIGENTVQGQINGMKGMKNALKDATTEVLTSALLIPAKELVNKASETATFGTGAIKAFLREFSGAGKIFNDTTAVKNATKAIEEYGQKLYKESEQYKEDTKTVKEHQKALTDLNTQRAKIQADIEKYNKINTSAAKEKVKELKEQLKETDTSIKAAKKQLIQDQKDIAQHTKDIYNEMKNSIKDSITSAIDPLKASLDTQVDLFAKFGNDTEVTVAEILENMQSQVDGISKWNADLNALAEKGFAAGLIAKLREMGPSSVNYVNSFMTMTTEEMNKANASFQATSELTAQTLLDSFTASINKAKEWANNMTELAKKGLNQDVLESLTAAGVDSAEYVNAFMTMTPEQIEEFNKTYKESLKLPESAASEIIASFSLAGTDAAKNFTTGLKELSNPDSEESNLVVGAAVAAIGLFSKTANSLSKTAGKDVSTNVASGINTNKSKPVSAASSLSTGTYNGLKTNLSAEKGMLIGSYVCQGLVQGLNNGKSGVISAAVNVAISAYEAAKDALDINSPSGEFEKLGMYADKGFIVGLVGYAKGVTDASSNVGTSAIDALKNSLSKIGDVVDSNMDVAPTIRPVIDISNIQNGIKSINSLFSAKQAMSVSASVNNADQLNSSDISEGSKPAVSNTYMMTQNNYSPKSLSRIEIYRQTRNQFSALKEVLE